MKGLIKGARNLRQLGIEELGLPLPKLIVVGDQSTGKSSLIEAIRSAIKLDPPPPVCSKIKILKLICVRTSEIKVPRNAGTCTRVSWKILI